MNAEEENEKTESAPSGVDDDNELASPRSCTDTGGGAHSDQLPEAEQIENEEDDDDELDDLLMLDEEQEKLREKQLATEEDQALAME